MTEVGWTLAEAAEVPADDLWLTPAERVTLAGLALPPRRAAWRLGRWTAKRAVAAARQAPGSPLATVEIRPAPDGAPEAFLLDGRPAGVALSLSHSGGRAVAAVVSGTGTALGIDLEQIAARSDAFVADYFTAAERALLSAAPPPERPLLANLLWSAKESAAKALREGLRLDTRSLEVSLAPNPPNAPPARDGWRPLAVHHTGTGRTFHGWWRQEDGCVLTLAADPAPAVPRRRP